jgi:SAP domain
MIAYSKLKVTELKELLKSRNIPLTGLKVKQNYIDRLVEADAAEEASKLSESTAAPGNGTLPTPKTEVRHKTSDVPATAEEVAQGEGGEVVQATPSIEKASESTLGTSVAEKVDPSNKNEAPEAQSTNENAQASAPNLSTSVADEDTPSKGSDTVDNGMHPTPSTESQDTAGKHAPAQVTIKDGSSEAQAPPDAASIKTPEASSSETTAPQPTPRPASDLVNALQPLSAQGSLTNTPSSGRVPLAEFLEDSRKRKRRSLTPPPSATEVAQKRAKGSDGSPRLSHREGSALQEHSEQSKNIDVSTNGQGLQEQAMEEAPALKDGLRSPSPDMATKPEQKVERRSPVPRAPSPQQNEDAPEPKQKEQSSPPKSALYSNLHPANVLRRRSPSPPKPLVHDERVVAPALHPATSSLYMRNFKRPLHIPSLRSHISAVAAAPNAEADDHSMTSFYLDSIRTHAFLTFRSIAAASRARSALHGSRFPDEQSREPLWVDFVPDQQIEAWIEIEQKANGGGRIGRRWEVIYETSADGRTEAILQEVGSAPAARPAPQPRIPSGPTERRESALTAEPSPWPSTGGVHPDRASLVPLAGDDLAPNRRREAGRGGGVEEGGPELEPPRPEQTGTGFRALDDLFPSTLAKPKLYYKAVGPRVAAARLEMIKDLRGLAGAKSGDPDMKRYSFAAGDGRGDREEWVDKGPEFGYGARGRGGLERGGRAGYRGRNAPGWRGGPERDSWRWGAR